MEGYVFYLFLVMIVSIVNAQDSFVSGLNTLNNEYIGHIAFCRSLGHDPKLVEICERQKTQIENDYITLINAKRQHVAKTFFEDVVRGKAGSGSGGQ